MDTHEKSGADALLAAADTVDYRGIHVQLFGESAVALEAEPVFCDIKQNVGIEVGMFQAFRFHIRLTGRSHALVDGEINVLILKLSDNVDTSAWRRPGFRTQLRCCGTDGLSPLLGRACGAALASSTSKCRDLGAEVSRCAGTAQGLRSVTFSLPTGRCAAESLPKGSGDPGC